MEKEIKQWFSGAIRDAWQAKLAEGKPVVATDVAEDVVKALATDPDKFIALRDHIFFAAGVASVPQL